MRLPRLVLASQHRGIETALDDGRGVSMLAPAQAVRSNAQQGHSVTVHPPTN